MSDDKCKIDAHVPTDSGEACLCGYFVQGKNMVATGNPADTSETIDEILEPIENDFVVSFSGDTGRLIDEAKAAIERLMKQERKQLLDEVEAKLEALRNRNDVNSRLDKYNEQMSNGVEIARTGIYRLALSDALNEIGKGVK